MEHITQTENWEQVRSAQYAETIGRIKAVLNCPGTTPGSRLKRIEEIIREAGI